MNSGVANLLKTLVSGLAVADKVAGLVRAIPRNQVVNGKTIVQYLPLSCDVLDPAACPPKEVNDLVPNGKYRSIIYFEDLGWNRQNIKLPGDNRFYNSKLRMVVWMNTKLIGPQCSTPDDVQQDVMGVIEVNRYNSDPYLQVQHRVVSVPPVSNAIFSRYTYNEPERQFLTYPYAYFALDIETKFILPLHCHTPITPEPIPC